MKKNKGITLIALVVTIVVLLILAGVSISYVLGSNGIIPKARYASFAQKINNYQDAVGIYAQNASLVTEEGKETIRDAHITITDKTTIKEIINSITDDDLEKYAIQENYLCYYSGKVTDQEKEWLTKLGVKEYSE